MINKEEIKQPYFLVVGCPRSGTTLLQRMLNAHPLLAIENDIDIIIQGLNKKQRRVLDNPPLDDNIIENVKKADRYSNFGFNEDRYYSIANCSNTFRDFLSNLFAEFANNQSKPFAGEKSARYLQSIQLVDYLLPWVKYIHIIRDGRDVALSKMKWAREGKGTGKLSLWKDEPIATCALAWRWQVLVGICYSQNTKSNNYIEIMYENLLNNTKMALESITNFLEIPYSDRMTEFYVGKTKNKSKLSSKNQWLPLTKGLRDWRKSMSSRDLELFEAIAGDLLKYLGYEVMNKNISSSVKTIAENSINWWQNEQKRPHISLNDITYN
ncbi:MAG: hypothetical protein GWN56_02015 [Nitrosopumilaceae archaeon]|nr:hypothetical protein [Nitrosopumilaceae archaeon]